MAGNRKLLVLGGLCLFQAGFIAGQIFGNDASAEEPTGDVAEEEVYLPPGSPPMLCKAFAVDATEPGADTTDTNSALGLWVSDREADGWTMYGMDFEIGQKATGFPQPWVQVCLWKQ